MKVKQTPVPLRLGEIETTEMLEVQLVIQWQLLCCATDFQK